MELTFTAVAEDGPGPAWAELFHTLWPAYRRWYLREGIEERPTYLACRRALHRHMPELVGVYDRLCELAGGGDLAARFISLYRPPAYLSGCSQAVWRIAVPNARWRYANSGGEIARAIGAEAGYPCSRRRRAAADAHRRRFRG